MRLLSLRLLLVAVAWLGAGPAAAVTYQFATPISGDVVPVTVSLADVPGGVDLTVSIAPGSGDLLGLFGSVTPESLVPQLSVANPTGVVTQWQFQANSVWKVGGGNTMSPVKTFDFGVKLGQTGGGGGALTSASFGLRAPGLTVASITGASTQGWVLGVRIQGTPGPEGSSKLGLAVGTPPVGEPPTIAITSPAEGALLPTSAVPVSGSLTGAGVAVSVDGTPASVGSGSFEATLTLADGPHTLVATATNAAGSASDSVSITVDTTPPVVTITAPADGTQTTEASVLVTGTVSDASPIVSFTVNGTPAGLAPDGSFAMTVPLALGPQAIIASATDAAGHPGSASVQVTRGEAPAVAIASPADGALLAASPMVVTGTVAGTEPITVLVNGVAAAVAGGSFTASVPLVEGANTLTATATSAFGEASASTPVTLDTTPPVVTITSPANGSLTAEASTPVTGTVFDASPIASLTVNGVAAMVTGSAFSASVALAMGPNPITATATDAAGHEGSAAISVTRGTAPAIAIASPAEGFETDAETILVSGTVSGTEPLLVSVNGVPATVSGGSYSAAVPLAEGANSLTATATSPLGSASASVSGTRTEGAPPLTISIATPPGGAFVSKTTVAVAGLVSDPAARVTVNGAATTVTGTSYHAPAVPLEEGPNPLVAVATRGTESAQAQVDITYNAPPRVVITSPPDGETLRTETTDVSGLVDDPTAFVDVNGVSARVEAGGRFVAEAVPLSPGENPLRARAIDLYGAEGTDETMVMRDEGAAPRLRIVLADPQRPPFPNPGAFDGPRVWETLVAEDGEEFRAALESEGYELARFEPAVAMPSIGRRFGVPGVYAFLFAEELGPGTVTLRGGTDGFSYFADGELLPIELLPDDLVFQFGDLDPAILGELVPSDFEARYYTRFQIEFGGSDGGSESAFEVPYEATSGAASDRFDLLYDLEAPGGQITSPAGGVVAGGSVTVTGWFESPGAPLYGEVQYEVLDELGTRILEGRAPLLDGQYSIPGIALGAGLYCIAVAPIDAAGNSEYANTCFESDPDAPAAALVEPQDGEAVLAESVDLDLNFAAPTILVAVNGVPDGRSFPAGLALGALTLPLALGPNAFTLDLEAGGTVFQLSFTLFRVDALGEVRITSPAQGALLNTPTVTVRGTAPRGTPLVEVNGIPAVLAADGVSFEATGVPVREGPNPLRAVAYPLGREALVTVTGDFTPPRFLAFVPEDGTATTAPEVTLAGFLSEGGSLSLQGPGGEVAGTANFAGTLGSGPFAAARYRFDLGPLALGPGPNALVLRATDGAGNVAEETLTLTRSDGALLFAAPTAPVPALRADVTLEVLEPVTLLAWYADGRRVPAVEGGTLSAGFVPVPNIPLLPGANAMRVVYQRAGGPPELLTFEVGSSATEVAVVEGVVTDTATGLPVAGALVQITVNGLTLAVVTDAEGRYRVEVEPGAFAVAAVGEGYAAGGTSGTGTGGGTTVADVGLAPTGLPGIQNQVAILVPPEGTVTDFEQVTVVGTVLNPGSVVTVNGIAAEVVGSRFTARHVPLAMGANTLQVTASALGSPAATDSVAVTRAEEPVLAVKIYSPPDGAIIPGSGLVVRGFVSAKRARTLVTDSFAPVIEGVFEVPEVRVAQGTATIGTLAQLGDGPEAASDTLAITVADAAPAIRLVADPRSGAVPFDARLEAVASRAFPVARIDFDLDGDRELDVVGSPNGITLASYTEAGPRLARVYFTLPSGAELSAAARVGAHLAEEVLGTFAPGNPVDLADAPEGGFYVLDGAAGVATRFDASHSAVATIGSGGAGPDQLSNPQALAVAPDGTVYVADTGNDRIQVFDPGGSHRTSLGLEGPAALDGPRGVALDGDVLAVSDTGNARVALLRTDGSFFGEFPLAEPRGIEAVAGYGFVVASPAAGLWAVLPEGDGVRARAISTPEVAAPVDVAIAEQGVLAADAGRSGVAQLSAQLAFERMLARNLTRPPRAVLGSARREVPALYVADGERVLEIAQPVPSPLPVVEGLKTRLRSGDVSGALSLFEPLQRLVFAEIYSDLGVALQTDANAMGALSIDLLREDRAIVRMEAELPTSTGSELRRFPVYLMRAEDGTWQIFDY